MTKSLFAKLLGWGQFVVVTAEQVSSGHFPQNKGEWFHFLTSLLLALAVHGAASTEGLK